MHDSPPPYPGINPNYTSNYPTQPNGFPAPQQPPQQMGFVAGGAGGFAPAGYPNAPAPSYPTLPQNGFEGGFQPGPSAPSSKLSHILQLQHCFKNLKFCLVSHQTKEQEAAAYYDPRAPNSAFVQTPQFYENPPAYSELDHKKQQ